MQIFEYQELYHNYIYIGLFGSHFHELQVSNFDENLKVNSYGRKIIQWFKKFVAFIT